MNRRVKAKLVLGMFLVAGFTTQASAQQVSLETKVSQFVVAQGQQMMTELTNQLSRSINQGVQAFRVDSDLLHKSELSERKVQKSQDNNQQKNHLHE